MGLETRDIRNIMKDSRGFLWFTSELGAYRFDGYEFKCYQRKLEGNEPFGLHAMNEDEEGNIWFSKFLYEKREILILPVDGDSLIRLETFYEEELPFSKSNSLSIRFSDDGGIWVVTTEGELFEYTQKRFKKIFTISGNHRLSDIRDLSITKDKGYFRWISVGQQLLKINTLTETVLLEEELPQKLKIHNSNNRGLWLIGKEEIFFKANDVADIASFTSSIQPAEFEVITAHGNTLINKDHFLVRDKKDGHKYTLFSADGLNYQFKLFEETIQNVNANNYFFDGDQTLWVTSHNGIYCVEFRKEKFKTAILGANTRKIVKDKNGFSYVASYGGLYKLNSENEHKVVQHFEKQNFGRSILIEENGDFWLGGGRQLVKSNIDNLYKYHEFWVTDSTILLDINVVHRDRRNKKLLLGTTQGLYFYEGNGGDFMLYDQTNDFPIIQRPGIYDIFQNDSICLIATSIGVFELSASQGIVQHFSESNNTLPYDNITHIHQDKIDGSFWLGTNYGGLIHWDMGTGSYQQFTKKDGLVDEMVYAVYEDSNANLWLPSNLGLMRFNKTTKDIRTFTIDDGIAFDEFNYFSHFQDEDGVLYLGGLNGVTIFDPNDLQGTFEDAPLHLTKVEKQDSKKGNFESVDWRGSKQEIIINPSENAIRFHFALLDYEKPENNQFAYRIEGLDKEWKAISGNQLLLNNLPFGKYNIQVKGENTEGHWSANQLLIPIEVLQPFYLKWWFLLLMVILLGDVIWLIVRSRTARLAKEKLQLESEVAKRTEEIQKQAEELKKLDEIKSRFFANVTHELRTPLSLILGPLERLMKKETFNDETLITLATIARNGENLKTLVEEIVDLNRYDAGKLVLNKEPVHVLQKVKECASAFDLEAQHRGIQFQVYFELPIDLYLLLDCKKIERIAANFLINAFKNSKEGDEVTLRVSEKKGQIVFAVKDTGTGIHPDDLPHIFERFYQSTKIDTAEQGGLGIGLALSKELAELMKGEIQVESTLGEGSCFSIILPKETINQTPSTAIPSIQEKGKSLAPTKDPGRDNTFISSEFDQTILIVEDNRDMRSFIEELFAPFFNLLQASNGKKALQILNATGKKIDLIISDVMMPEMDGFTFLEHLKEKEEWQFIPVVMLTARTNTDDKLKALTIGIDDYITKPFQADELVARVQRLLENVSMREKVAVSAGDFEIEAGLPELESADMKWLKELEQTASNNVMTPNFNVMMLASEMAISQRQLNRKLKNLTGLTPGNYINEIRLQTARNLLENKTYKTVAEVSYAIGFSTPKYFSTLFHNRFGNYPSELLK